MRLLDNVNDGRAVAALIREFRLERPDLVHTHSSKAGIVGRVAARMVGIPAVHTVHGWSFHAGMGAAAQRAAVLAERAAARLTSAFVVVCEHDRVVGLTKGIGSPDRYHVIRSGIDVTALGWSAD